MSANSPEELQAALDARPELQRKLAAALGQATETEDGRFVAA